MITIYHKRDLERHTAGAVFHATPYINYNSIVESGGISPNTKFERKSLFGNTENGYFRQRGCVSFFDYRDYGSPEWQQHAYKCTPTQILCRAESIVLLILCASQFSKLISWRQWKEDEAWSQRVVPHVEAGYPGQVSLRYITEVLYIDQAYS